jgi:hypothetical protein
MENNLVNFRALDGTILYCAWDATEPVTYTCPAPGYTDSVNIYPITRPNTKGPGLEQVLIICEVVNGQMNITIRPSTPSEIEDYIIQVEIDTLNSLNNN